MILTLLRKHICTDSGVFQEITALILNKLIQRCKDKHSSSLVHKMGSSCSDVSMVKPNVLSSGTNPLCSHVNASNKHRGDRLSTHKEEPRLSGCVHLHELVTNRHVHILATFLLRVSRVSASQGCKRKASMPASNN